MKLLYVNPPKNPNIYYKENIIPLSLLYLAAVARKQCETKVLDLKTVHAPEAEDTDQAHCYAALEQQVRTFAPDIVGITCLFSGDITHVLKVASCVKHINSGILVVIGGMHPTLNASEIIRHCLDIDFVIIGEGEESTDKLLTALRSGAGFSEIDGIAYRTYEGRPMLTAYCQDRRHIRPETKDSLVCCQPKTSFIQNIDQLPPPAYDLFQFSDYYSDTSHWYNPNHIPINGLSVPILTSRSCPTSCNFCSMSQVMGPRFRARSAQSVVDEIQSLYERYGVRYFSIMDDNFTLDKRRTLQICNLICAKNLKIAIECNSGLFINSLDDEVIDALVSAGLIMTAVAIESGSDYIRNQVIGKHLRREKIYEVVSSFCRHPSVYLYGFFIIGFPEDTDETILETYHMAEDLELDDISVNPLTPLPGTRLFEQCERENLFLHPVDYDNLWRDEGLFCTPYESQFFIQPYHLTIQQLEAHYRAFVALKQKKREAAKLKGKRLSRQA